SHYVNSETTASTNTSKHSKKKQLNIELVALYVLWCEHWMTSRVSALSLHRSNRRFNSARLMSEIDHLYPIIKVQADRILDKIVRVGNCGYGVGLVTDCSFDCWQPKT
ncbi:hypothetical protein WA026_004217, partial [Henosepilachna vigintioctopunctata]